MFIFLTLLSFILNHKSCGYSFLKRRSLTGSAPFIKVDYEKEDLKQFKKLRIFTDFSGLVSNNPEAKELTEKIKTKIMPKTIKVFSDLFKVRRVKSITLNEKRCQGEYDIPEKVFKGKAIETDLILLVNYDQTGVYNKNNIEASAIHCFQDATTKRPIVGLVTFKDNMKVKTDVDIDYLVWLCLHEISHVLLFNEDMYPNFIDENLNQLQLSDIIYTEHNKYGQKIDYVKTKKVMEVAKKHFKCDSLKGIPLEFNGGESAVGGHWSRRALNTDYMIGRSHGENLISPITLAFFEDSGWYKSDFRKANIFYWGKNKGCDFITKNCVKESKYISTEKKTFKEILKKHKGVKKRKIMKKYRNSIEGDIHDGLKNMSIQSNIMEVTTFYKKEFCEELNQPVCSQHNKFRGYCGARVHNSNLNEKDRQFVNSRVGGMDLLVNYCPIVVEDKFDQKFYGGNCEYGSKKDLLSYEKIGKNSGCFVSSLHKENKPTKSPQKTAYSLEVYSIPKIKGSRAACIEYHCDKGEIYLTIDNKKTHCPSNKTIKIEGYEGKVQCADKKVMCHKKYHCKFGCTDVE